MLVEGADDDGDGLAVAALEALGELGQTVKPFVEGTAGFTSILEDFGCDTHRLALIYPGIVPVEGIVHMQAGHHHHSAVVGLLDQFLAQGIVIGLREVVVPVIHKGGQVEGIYGGIVAAHVLGVGSAFGAIPLAAIHQVVVVPEHPTMFPDSPQAGIEGLGFGRSLRIHHGEFHGVVIRPGDGIVILFVAAPQERRRKHCGKN